MGRAPCCDKANVKKGPWSPEEDTKLKEYIEKHGTGGNWIALPTKAGLKRCGKSCRLRWLNYLRPNIKHGEFSDEEDRIICTLFASIGSRWSIIAAQLPGRTDNDIKNYWNTKLKKKLLAMAPQLQRPKPPLPFPSSDPSSFTSSSSSYPYNTINYNYVPNYKSIAGFDPTVSNLFINSPNNNSLFQTQDGLMGPLQYNNNNNNSILLSFGGNDHQGGSCSTTSNSDGSCNNNNNNNNNISYGRSSLEIKQEDMGFMLSAENQKFVLTGGNYGCSYNNNGGGSDINLNQYWVQAAAADQKQQSSNNNGCFGGDQNQMLDFDHQLNMEVDVKQQQQLIISSNIDNIGVDHVDENKTQSGKVMYYYY